MHQDGLSYKIIRRCTVNKTQKIKLTYGYT